MESERDRGGAKMREPPQEWSYQEFYIFMLKSLRAFEFRTNASTLRFYPHEWLFEFLTYLKGRFQEKYMKD